METDKRWRRKAIIGRGSYGTISLAAGEIDGRIFAVKSVSTTSPAAAMAALENEIAILKSLSSPYIVSYLGDDVTDDPLFERCRNLHIEFAAGGCAADRVLIEQEAREYVRCAALGLNYLHSIAGIVHGDVKGRNLLVVDCGGAAAGKLSDFGSAAIAGEKSVARGTPMWMAPEVARGESLSPASDVWSLGCTVVELLTGKTPWRFAGGKDPASVLYRIGFSCELLEIPECISPAARDFVDKCFKIDAKDRWTTEQLLRHPFLIVSDKVEQTPRCVFDWFDGGDSEEENDKEEEESDMAAIITVRIAELSSGAGLEWEDVEGGWETVRHLDIGGEVI